MVNSAQCEKLMFYVVMHDLWLKWKPGHMVPAKQPNQLMLQIVIQLLYYFDNLSDPIFAVSQLNNICHPWWKNNIMKQFKVLAVGNKESY